jgi:radical SAM protein with 4Fe4S-binding SPASM domain
MLAHVKLGRINEDSFVEVWQKSYDLTGLRERHHIPLTQFEECVVCDYAPYCTGNCPGSAFNLTGQVNRPSPDACLQRFLNNGGNIPSFEETT